MTRTKPRKARGFNPSSPSSLQAKNPKKLNPSSTPSSFQAKNPKKRKVENVSSSDYDKRPPSNKKRALKLSRQATRQHSDIVLSAKEIWNSLRMHENTPQQVSTLMEKLMNLLQGKFAQVACKHDASRIIQAALQFADESQRILIVQELCALEMNLLQPQDNSGSSSIQGQGGGGGGGDDGKQLKQSKTHNSTSYLVELACSQYAHFIVLKMIKLCVKEPLNIKTIVKAIKGSVLKLALHSVGARVIETLFLTFPPKSTSILKVEFYGPQLTLFHTGEYSSGTIPSTQITLSSILNNEPESTQQAVLKFFNERVIQKGSEKKLFSFSFYQQLLWEYVSFVPRKVEVRTLAANLCDHSLALLSTRAGSEVVAECIAYGTPKERKRIIKSLKGNVRSTALHSDAYVAILRLLESTDDTVLIQKSILGELVEASSKDTLTMKKQKIAAATMVDEEDEQQDVDDMIVDSDEKKEVLKLSSEENDHDQPEITNTEESPLLALALSEGGCRVLLLILAKSDEERKRYLDPWNLEILHTNPCVMEDGKEVPTSKKNKETRRMELLEYMKSALIQLCEQHTGVLIPSKFGSRVLRAAYETWSTDTLANSVVAACDEPMKYSNVANIFEHPFGHLVVKNLILHEIEVARNAEASTSKDDYIFASKLYQKFKGQLRKVIASSSRGAFVLAALASIPDAIGNEVRKELKKNEKEILAKIQGNNERSTSIAGYEALFKAITLK